MDDNIYEIIHIKKELAEKKTNAYSKKLCFFLVVMRQLFNWDFGCNRSLITMNTHVLLCSAVLHLNGNT